MNHYIQVAATYITNHKKAFTLGSQIVLGIGSIGILTTLVIYNYHPTIVYTPIDACALLTPAKAQDLLGDKVISLDSKGTVLSGSIATSKCSYTDESRDQNTMMVAAIAVRSGVNDKGVEQNKADFLASMLTGTIEPVKALGERAYFNPKLGQLNILDGHRWIIISYGIGSAPEANTVDKAVTMAHKII